MKKIKMLLLDVDGTLTDGKLYFFREGGKEYKAFNTRDGMGMEIFLSKGRDIAIISGHKSEAVENRMKELNIKECHLGIQDKEIVVKDIMQRYSLSKEELACVGDDINDIGMFSMCALSFAPNDAHYEVLEVASIVLKHDGGHGAVREAIDYILLNDL